MIRDATALQELCSDAGALASAVVLPDPALPARLHSLFQLWETRHGGALPYIDTKLDTICDPFGHRPWARAALVIAFHAPPADSPLRNLPPARTGRPSGTIAAYALKEDYHVAGKRILLDIASRIGATQIETCVDAGPVPEVELAIAAGLGSRAPNCMVHLDGAGCAANLAILFTDLPLPRIPIPAHPDCPHCLRCLQACQNHALSAEGLDVRRCRSYLSGQFRGPLSWEQQLLLHDTLFGCSDCSHACPDDPAPACALRVDCLALLEMPTAELRRTIAGTAIEHSGTTLLKRNAVAILGTHSTPDERNTLRKIILPLCASPTIQQTIQNWP
ncbi:MAG: epoxyqueuosine reductase [Victivallales bacterium]|nr:epoxyqueuosine reductase [Victivallales bacterium]